MGNSRGVKILLASAVLTALAGGVFYLFHAFDYTVLFGLLLGWGAGVAGLSMFQKMAERAEKNKEENKKDPKSLGIFYSVRLLIIAAAVVCAVLVPFIDAVATIVALVMVTPAASVVLLLEEGK